MGIRRIKFVWGSDKVIVGRWWFSLFCRYASRPGFPGSGLAISVRGLLVWAAIFGVLAYAGSVWIVSRSLRGVPAGEATWVDAAAWPLRRANINRLRGRAWIERGREALAAHRFAEGVFYLRQGLAGDPGDFAARLTLAQLALEIGDRVHGLALLADGPDHGLPNAESRRAVLVIGFDGEEWNFVATFVDRCLRKMDTATAEERGELIAAKAKALQMLGRGSEALDLLRTQRPPTKEVKIELVHTLLAQNRVNDAIAYLADWRRTATGPVVSTVIRLQAKAYRLAGRMAEFDQALADLRANQPGEPQPAAFAVVELALAGRDARPALEDYLFRFGGKPANLRLVAESLSDISAVPLLQRLLTAATEQGLRPRALQIELALALLRQNDGPALGQLLNQMETQAAPGNGEGALWFEWMRRLSRALTSSEAGAQRQVVDFAVERSLSLRAYEDAISALRRAGRIDTALQVAIAARRRFTESPSLGASLQTLQREQAAQVAAKPAASTPREAIPDSDVFFGGLDHAVATAQWQDARDRVNKIRALRPPPPWLAPRDMDLLRRELRIDRALGDVLALRLAATLLLQHGPEHIEELLAFARECDVAGDRADGLLIVKLILDAHPLNQPARTLSEAWEPKRSNPSK